MSDVTLKASPLHAEHLGLGGRIIPFGGWEMPVQYSGIIDEHTAVRSAAGIFDISHMAQVAFTGPQAGRWLDTMFTNSVSKLADGVGHYSFMLNERGGVIDDLILYRKTPDSFFVVLNAAVAGLDIAWLRSHLPASGVEFHDLRTSTAAVALQGPASPGILKALDLPVPDRYTHTTRTWNHHDLLIAGTGYTGEIGCEIFAPRDAIVELWRTILSIGSPFGLKPCGLGARDTLRLEMGYPLNGSDLAPDISPLEAGLSVFVDLSKSEFIGREALLAQKAAGLSRRLCALLLQPGSPPPRAHYPVLHDGNPVGELTSGALSPSLGRGIAMAYLPPGLATVGSGLDVEIRSRHYKAEVVRKPFV